jgi:hypothetical protein
MPGGPNCRGRGGFTLARLWTKVRNRPVSKDLDRTWGHVGGLGDYGFVASWSCLRGSLCLQNARRISLDTANCNVLWGTVMLILMQPAGRLNLSPRLMGAIPNWITAITPSFDEVPRGHGAGVFAPMARSSRARATE